MKVTIIGRYGTETIGDRAILAGIFSLLNKSFEHFEVSLGSLFPFFSKRTISEDSSFYKKTLGKDIKIKLFDSNNYNELDKSINNNELIIIGGGPLMHIDEIYMLEYAFKKARKLGKKTIIMGCGIGPIFTLKHKKSLINIVKNSNLTILRDSLSKDNLINIIEELKEDISICNNIKLSIDPAIEACINYLKINPIIQKEKCISINLRDFPKDYSQNNLAEQINKNLKEFIEYVAEEFNHHTIKLIPMHYFHMGTDDREFLNEIKFTLNNTKLKIQNTPLTLEETLQVFQKSKFTIGMRFHSVVFQTIVNGNNYILDYTEPKKGKIAGFINDIDEQLFYKDRYVSLQNESSNIKKLLNFVNIEKSFDFNKKILENKLKVYVDNLKNI